MDVNKKEDIGISSGRKIPE